MSQPAEPPEARPEYAPVWYRPDEANAWAAGWNACIEHLRGRAALRSGPPPADEKSLDELVEEGRVGCHKRRCRAPATKVYTVVRPTLSGGVTPYRYQRCDAHPVQNASTVEPFAASFGGPPKEPSEEAVDAFIETYRKDLRSERIGISPVDPQQRWHLRRWIASAYAKDFGASRGEP